MKIRLVQMNCPKGAVEENLTRIKNYIVKAVTNNVDIICFPEASITGYIDPEKFPGAILSSDDKRIQGFIEFTKQYPITAIIGLVEKNKSNLPSIAQLVISEGGLLGTYRKSLLAPEEKPKFTPGNEKPVFDNKGIKFGIAICKDIDNELLFKEYASQGVSLVFEAAAPGLYGSQENRDWEKGFLWWKKECKEKLGKYARENNLHIAVSTQAGRTVDEDFPGGGYVFNPQGECVSASKNEKEDVLDYEIA
jgi:predicted amidohydrolase